MSGINGFNLPSGSTVYVSPVAGEQLKTLKSTSGLLHDLRVANTTAAKIYVFVFDNASAASGALLMPPIPIAANDMSLVQVPGALPFANGCTVAASTTQAAYAAAGANAMQILGITK